MKNYFNNERTETLALVTRRRKTRAKRHYAWENLLKESDHYAVTMLRIASKFPSLSSSELRVSTLVVTMLPSRVIAEKLHLDERTVENHRVRIRRKLGIKKGSLAAFLIQN
jgi:FixJ family two-component response regulator